MHKIFLKNHFKIDTKWIKAFYKHSLGVNEKTVSMINEVLTWRKKFNANGLTTFIIYFYYVKKKFKKRKFKKFWLDLLKPGVIPEELFQLGAMFYRNKDKHGFPLC